jgi:hypothetical protein
MLKKVLASPQFTWYSNNMKYVSKNQKTSDCAIVGLLNASVWLNKGLSYEDIEFVAKEYFSYDPETGFDLDKLNDFSSFIGISLKRVVGKTDRYVEKKILEGNAAVAVVYKDEQYHMIFLRPTDNGVKVLNISNTWEEILDGVRNNEAKMGVWLLENAA